MTSADLDDQIPSCFVMCSAVEQKVVNGLIGLENPWDSNAF